MISMWVKFGLWWGKLSKYWIVGIKKVVVLLVLVGVDVKILWFFSVLGIVCCWILVGVLKFILLMVFNSLLLILNLENCIEWCK